MMDYIKSHDSKYAYGDVVYCDVYGTKYTCKNPSGCWSEPSPLDPQWE